ncbi:MAG: prephenate dehydrogenase [Planctomycetota bacterium]
MPGTTFHTDQLTVIGPGLLGTSVALGLRQRGFAGRIVALARRQRTLDLARASGGYDTLTTDPAAALENATLALIAVPLSAFRGVFAQIAEHGPAGMVVTDVGSTKASVIADARAELADLSRVIGAHPMAGSENAGPSAGDPDLFLDKPCVMTVSDDDDPQAIALVESLWASLGMSLLRMSPSEHDRQVALVSHLPHLVAVMLMGIAADHGGLDLASTGFMGATRLASSNPPMRADILAANHDEVRHALARLRGQCERVEHWLERGDHSAMLDSLERAASARAAWIVQRAQQPTPDDDTA